MSRISASLTRTFLLPLAAVLAGSVHAAGDELDRSRYITVDEIRPGMEAYCLTVYEGTQIEKFALEVLDVVRKWRPGKDGILVRGTDERFIRSGPVMGCSGSPVYIEGRLAGALAWGSYFSKDAFYIATPIEEMLRVGQKNAAETPDIVERGFAFDFSRPIDFAEIDAQIVKRMGADNAAAAGATALPCPLVVSGLPAAVTEQLDAFAGPLGLKAVAGPAGGAGLQQDEQIQLAPGACLAVALVTGDITMDAVGTVTEVVGDKVYAFGHNMLGYGPIDLPMAAGRVHAVVSSVMFSYKMASAAGIVGALRADESTAIFGQIGAKARMIPMVIKVSRYNDAETRLYNCQIADNRLITPAVFRLCLTGAALMLGPLPPDHTIEYKVKVGVQNTEPISFENVSTSTDLDEMIAESTGSVALLMNNPYKTVRIDSIEAQVHITPKSAISQIWSVSLSDSQVKAGQEVKLDVVVESFLAEKKRYEARLRIPEELPAGEYELLVCGGYGYLQFLMKAAPNRFTPQNLTGLIEAINYILHVRRDELYCILLLPAGGVTVENAELPDLPATKTLVLQDAKRTLTARPYQHWVERNFRTGAVIIDKKVMRITVED
ncbi:MAG TPA: SpoIVB peptidase S55 domain-containing protein [Sedimentisphaerales bacterium]|nr:SpoIVB peptidase S55 domain-containing protein [Sedimentisphaerales bacterium]